MLQFVGKIRRRAALPLVIGILGVIAVGMRTPVAAARMGSPVVPGGVMHVQGAFEFNYSTWWVCPLNCGSTPNWGWFNGTATGQDVNGNAFTATFATTSNNVDVAKSGVQHSQICSGTPDGAWFGGGTATLWIGGGTVTDNGTTSPATLVLYVGWRNTGTAAVVFHDGTNLEDASGNIIASSLEGGAGAGTWVPTTLSPNGIPMSCFDQWWASFTVEGQFVGTA